MDWSIFNQTISSEVISIISEVFPYAIKIFAISIALGFVMAIFDNFISLKDRVNANWRNNKSVI